MQRLADVRIWAYITARPDWMRDAAPWANRAREIEDKISDTLHEKLMARFVDKRAAHLTRRLEANETEELLSVVSTRGVVFVEGHEVGHVEGFTFHPDPLTQGQEKKLVLRAARRALGQEMPRRILRAETASDLAFKLLPNHRIVWEGAEIARLKRGATILRPAVEMLNSEFLDGAARERLRLRLTAFITAEIDGKLGPLTRALAAPPPELRGVLHRLGEALGILPGEDIPPALRPACKQAGLIAGRFALFMPAILKPKPAALRAILWALWHGQETPVLPEPGLVSADPPAGWSAQLALAMGWLPAGPVMLRLDVAERMGRELHYLIRKQPMVLPAQLGSRMSLKPEQLSPVLNTLGLRVIPAATLDAKTFGPPAPPMLARSRHTAPRPPRPAPPPEAAPAPDNPFAALAALKRA
jgi:ATP-dependent RNA helicase SUPV3L1/SUV3